MRHNVEEAKRRRNEKLRQTRNRQSLTVLSAAFLVIALAVAAYYIVNSDFWLIKKITVMGNNRLSAKQVVDLADVDYRTNLLRLPAAEITANLKKNPWVKAVELSRDFPDRLTIQITERKPFVGVKQGDKLIILDKAGFAVAAASGPSAETSMAVISDIKVAPLKVGVRGRGANLRAALASLARLDPDLKAKVTWVSVTSVEKLTFQTADGLEVVYGGPEESVKKNFLIKKILAGATGKIVHINVTAPDNPVVRKLN